MNTTATSGQPAKPLTSAFGPAARPVHSDPLEAAVRQWGDRLFSLMDAVEAPSLFSAKGLYGALMDWAMKDETFKVQLFRFVDALPTLTSSGEVSRHLSEYLDNDQVNLNPALRAALKATSFAGGLLGGGIKAQVTGMARMFMLGSDPKEIVSILKRLSGEGAAFTVDVLGEAVVSEKEADEYAGRYLDLMDLLARAAAGWLGVCRSDLTPAGAVPRLNISIKLSAFYSQIHATDPDTAIAKLSARLRPVLRRARELGAFICVDMESYALKNLTLQLFKSIFSEPEFADGPPCGLALQAYLKDSAADLKDVVAWARARRRRITIRLVKGAYWDYETVMARQRGWPPPVLERKPESDTQFEKLSLYLLENQDAVGSAFASHNIRSLAHVLAQADRLSLDRRAFEMQVLYGMADTIKSALLEAGCRVRVYCPVGELLPGMAYLVRRLLENTSNEGFLANKFAKGASREALLRSPPEALRVAQASPSPVPAPPKTVGLPDFHNEPPTDFTRPAERERVLAALHEVRSRMGRRHPLVIGGRAIETRDWAPSLNPADQNEIIGYAALAGVADADAALAVARAAQGAWARLPVAERGRLFHSLGKLLRRDKAQCIALLVLEAGKNWTEADGDVAEAIDFCHFNAVAMQELGRTKRTQIVPGETNVQHWWPRGVGLVVSPWNFPLAILTGMMSAAAVAGNTVILKPSGQTTVIAARLLELAAEAGFPAGVINLITGRGSEIGAHLIAHHQLDFVAFTGSMEVGLNIWEVAGRTPPGQACLKKVICEMGGKNALIVDGDADLDEAVAGTLQSAFGYNGQKCSALSRLIVVADNHDQFVERLVAATASLRIGPAELPGNIIGPVIDRASQHRILAMIEAGRQEATLAWQGQVPDQEQACYVPPSIFTGVPPDSRLFREEIFGPVLSITRAGDFEEALRLANDCAFALTGGLYSRSPTHIERAKAEFACGNLYINRGITGALVGRQPFGGFKMSGGGTKAGGLEYLENFLVPRVITENCLRRGFAPVEKE
jgi:RHH-type transcriptional regulator, proline utilization regulon repressor / proline dehydrogenase / delta 1-pyrroline-5-carboxylate dehydrogenase